MSRSVFEIGLSVKRLQVQHHRAANERLAPLGLTIVQWDALRHLHQNPDASLHALAILTFQTDQAFGTLATRMIDRGLIERIEGPGRAVRHRLTPRGEELRGRAEGLLGEVLAESFAPLSASEQETLGALLDRLVRP
jgi:DNA-binding MarR family transcriptional regulator